MGRYKFQRDWFESITLVVPNDALTTNCVAHPLLVTTGGYLSWYGVSWITAKSKSVSFIQPPKHIGVAARELKSYMYEV
jgi:hypothetical protein